MSERLELDPASELLFLNLVARWLSSSLLGVVCAFAAAVDLARGGWNVSMDVEKQNRERRLLVTPTMMTSPSCSLSSLALRLHGVKDFDFLRDCALDPKCCGLLIITGCFLNGSFLSFAFCGFFFPSFFGHSFVGVGRRLRRGVSVIFAFGFEFLTASTTSGISELLLTRNSSIFCSPSGVPLLFVS